MARTWLSRRRSFCLILGITSLILLCSVITVFILILLLETESTYEEDFFSNVVEDIPPGTREYPILLWWTPFTGEDGAYKKCGKEICFFTQQRKYFSDHLTRALFFYGTDFKPTDLPLPRLPHHDWALLHEESPKNNYLFSFKYVMELFNHTSTFRRESDLPLTFQFLKNIESLTSKEYFVPTSKKFKDDKGLAPVVYVQSDCNAPSERDSYVEELAKYIMIDSYGKCLQNKELPLGISDGLHSMDSEEFLKIMAQYKFTLAFENAVCVDYITEKLWRPLALGSVPIYFGSPKIMDWLPNPESAILVENFTTPKAMAEYLLLLSNDSSSYNRHLEHKINGTVSNLKLVHAMKAREWGIGNSLHEPSFIDKFECLVCQRVAQNYKHELLKKSKGVSVRSVYQASLEDYGCPKPVPPFYFKSDSESWWLELYNKAKFEAQALENLMKKNANFSSTEFYQTVIDLLENSTR